MSETLDIATDVVRWQAVHGRNHLPWQQTRDPYRVWLSEIMLQQTQVVTVLGYYERFLEKFPNVQSLASASEGEVLALWSGLGYYSRARNLHRCAQQIVEIHGGYFPPTAEALSQLPGIGRSTAGAITSFCFSERVPILDANVRRVLTRVLGFSEDLAISKNERLLWDRAQGLLPKSDLHNAMPRYTQGLMDLGASLCTPKKPACMVCPLSLQCKARRDGDPERYPVRTRKLLRRAESWWLMLLRNEDGRVFLEQRPSTGIWAGLHCLPVFTERAELQERVKSWPVTFQDADAFLHVLTHRDLHLHPVQICWRKEWDAPIEGAWFKPAELEHLGLPTPIRKLLKGLS
ncbi:A/G-specific adenine glycosylase [Acidovorax sp. SUPP3334]|uniref:A/G-specific adenine glycosylase n=1 Tax=Acidovorax sp. SUPP3334 TaxID=2920881 RepID=UPI0023DE6060|nr:A/G-specific adenine glycosylase [Acidovorax sp. SUPP3334]GKT20412.1 A/G-specific adenine glycosylase [Acidovorax sp. SUPP3334]